MEPSTTPNNNGSLRVYFDDDDESYFDLNVDAVSDSRPLDDFRFSHLPDQHDLQSPTLLPSESPTHLRRQPKQSPEPPGPAVAPRRSINLPSRVTSKRSTVFSSSRSLDEAAASALKAKGLAVENSSTQSRSTAAIITSGMLKLLIKFPSEKIRMTFLSMARSRSRPPILTPIPRQNNRSPADNGPTRRRRPLYRTLVVAPLRKIFASKRSPRGSEIRPKIVDIGSDHSDLLKAVTDAMNAKGGGGYNNWSHPRSAPTSLQSSPRHSSAYSMEEEMKMRMKVVERESSISSAIAHCKGVLDHELTFSTYIE